MDATLLGELVITGGVPIIAAIGVWIKMRVDVGNLNTKLDYLDKQLTEEKEGNKVNFEKLNDKMDNMAEVMNDIKIALAKK